jgi:hypothetical protein
MNLCLKREIEHFKYLSPASVFRFSLFNDAFQLHVTNAENGELGRKMVVAYPKVTKPSLHGRVKQDHEQYQSGKHA